MSNIVDKMVDLKSDLVAFGDLITSTSFVEGNKVALDVMLNNQGLSPVDKTADVADSKLKMQKSWSDEMTAKERITFAARKIVNSVSSRFKYTVLLAHSSMDLVASLVMAVASTILLPTGLDLPVEKRWRHTGIALYTVLNSVLGVVSPHIASKSQMLFTVSVLSIHGKSFQEKLDKILSVFKTPSHTDQPSVAA